MSDELTTIKPTNPWFSFDLKDLWSRHELLYFLTWRDIKVRYKQTFIGVGWAILQPFLTMVVFTVFFKRLGRIPSEGIPYPIFSYSGLLLWIYFSSSVTHASNSLISNEKLITKVYFPRFIVPVSSVITGFVDYLIALSILVAMMFFYHVTPSPFLLLLPFFLFLAFLSTTGLGFWLSALNIKYRDVRYAIPFFIQLLLFTTPVIYPVKILPHNIRWLLSLNPISGIIDAHRACILGHKPIDWMSLGISAGVTLVIFITGVLYFNHAERFFADII